MEVRRFQVSYCPACAKSSGRQALRGISLLIELRDDNGPDVLHYFAQWIIEKFLSPAGVLL
jgi:hypothetical protein